MNNKRMYEPTKKKKHWQLWLVIALILLIAGGLILYVMNYRDRKPLKALDEEVVKIETSPFEDILLEAQAVYVWDSVTKETLYSQNAEAQLPLASLAKIMVAIVASERLPRSTLVTISDNALQEDSDDGLLRGEKWRLEDLLDFILVASSNDGAAAVAEAFSAEKSAENDFVVTMNIEAQALGLSQTYFLNSSGLDINDEELGGSFGSARDIAHMFAYAIKHIPRTLEATRYNELAIMSLDDVVHNVKNTNVALDTLPWVIGSKTGYTDNAGGNLVVAFDAGLAHPVIAVVLASSIEGRFTDMEKLVATTFEHFATD
jgi:D-alanyl-D-alanine carboxypeptidase